MLRAELLGIEPLIWQGVRVPGAITLRELHDMLQMVMRWQDFHLQDFRIGDALIGVVDRPKLAVPKNMDDERTWTVAQVVGTGVTESEYGYNREPQQAAASRQLR